MMDGHALGVRRSMILWIGTALLIAFNLFAATQQSAALTYAALAVTGAFALFGIWAARTVTRKPIASDPASRR